MTSDYNIKDILSAVDTLLDDKGENTLKLIDNVEKPLLLKTNISKIEKKDNNVPKNTEKIILQAEKYLKR